MAIPSEAQRWERVEARRVASKGRKANDEGMVRGANILRMAVKTVVSKNDGVGCSIHLSSTIFYLYSADLLRWHFSRPNSISQKVRYRYGIDHSVSPNLEKNIGVCPIKDRLGKKQKNANVLAMQENSFPVVCSRWLIQGYIMKNIVEMGIADPQSWPPIFTVDTAPVLELFTGKNFYENADAGLREAILNAIDAIGRRREFEPTLKQEIDVTFDSSSHTITIADNGVGMDQGDITRLSDHANSYTADNEG